MSDERQYIERPIWIAKWRRRWDIALDLFDRPGFPFVAQPSTIIIKGDADLVLQASIYILGDTEFASEAVFIKGDTLLIAEQSRTIKGDTVFARFAIFIKGDATLLENVPLPDLGENPADTKPGAIQRTWLQVESVKKDVT